MATARRHQVSLDHTRYYHCMSRCVRQAYLCGNDRHTGKCYEHRRRWLEDRLVRLSQVFAIEILAYAIMNNHYHLVIHVDDRVASTWSNADVLKRWSAIFKAPVAEPNESRIGELRERLSSISWFMRCLNECIARRANREDGCTGRFWDGRYKLQALLDESAVLRCMCYVDLNPIRAGLAKTPERSRHTSVYARIRGHDDHLASFQKSSMRAATIPLSKTEYLRLVDYSGRILRADKKGAIPTDTPPILQRLNIAPSSWRFEMLHYGRWYYRAVGSAAAMSSYCKHLGQNWMKGMYVLVPTVT